VLYSAVQKLKTVYASCCQFEITKIQLYFSKRFSFFFLQEIKIEPVDIDISNDSTDPIDDGFDMNKVSNFTLQPALDSF
jgi:hypothetical protein